MRAFLAPFLLMTATTLAAAGLPDYYPLQMPNTGQVDRIGDGQIVINDSLFRLADRLVVHTQETEFASRAELEAGGRIGYRSQSTGSGYPLVTEIWVLPEGRHDGEE